ncbi:MAG: calcium-binding protein, partial [Paracoccaceae bacterium]
MTNAITPLIGTSGADTLNGAATGDVVSGRQGTDTVNGNAGNDLAHGGGASDLINGGTGNDVLYGGGGPGLLDMTQLKITENHMGRVTFISEGAGFQNSLIMYKIDANGTISDVDVLFANSSAVGSGGHLVPGQSYVDVPLQ